MANKDFNSGFAKGVTNDPTIRLRVETILQNKSGDVFVGHRQKDGHEWYMFPGGGVDDGETLLEAGKREVAEETGKHATAITPLSSALTFYTPYQHDSKHNGSMTAFVTGLVRGGKKSSKYGADNDIIEDGGFVNPKEALKLLKINDDYAGATHRVKALRSALAGGFHES